MKKLSFLILTLFLLNSSAFGQSQSDRRWGVPEFPQNCEQGLSYIEDATMLMGEEPSPNGVFILIARLGTGETRSELNRRRLFNISDRFISARGVSPEKVITTIGKKVNGLGRVEIYWKGEMVGALLADKNRDICVSCCPSNEDHYPGRDALKRQQKRKKRG